MSLTVHLSVTLVSLGVTSKTVSCRDLVPPQGRCGALLAGACDPQRGASSSLLSEVYTSSNLGNAILFCTMAVWLWSLDLRLCVPMVLGKSFHHMAMKPTWHVVAIIGDLLVTYW